MAILMAFTILIASSIYGARPIISYVALSLGAGPTEIGLIASSYAILALLLAIPLGRLTDRIGERPIMLAGGALCSTTCLALPYTDSLVWLAVAQAGLGLGQMLAIVGSHSLLAGYGSHTKRPFRIGLYTSAASLGHAVGPGFTGLLIGQEFTREAEVAALVAAGCVAAVASVLVLALPGTDRASSVSVPPNGSIGLQVLRLPGMLAAIGAGVVALTTVDLLVAYLPVYGEERQISPSLVGSALAVLALAQMLSRIGLGPITTRYSLATIALLSMTAAAAAIPVLILPLDGWGLMVVMAITGLGLGLVQPLSLLWVAIATPPADRGLAMGVRMSGSRLGQLAVPLAVAATAGQIGVSAVFLTIAAMLAGAAGYVFHERDLLDTIRNNAADNGVAATGSEELENHDGRDTAG